MNSEENRGRSKRRPVVTILLTTAVLLFGSVCFFSARWYVRIFGRIGFDSILFTLTGGMGGASTSLIADYLIGALAPAFALTAGLTGLCFLLLPKRFPSRSPKTGVTAFLLVALSVAMTVFAAFDCQLVDYIRNMFTATDLYSADYRDPAQVNITFPEKKRNLVYIYLESMEISFLSKEKDGVLDYDLIPELYDLAKENINFSSTTDVGGFRPVTGASWTVGAMVAQTAGIPLRTPSNVSDWQNGYGQKGNFLPGATTLMDILHQNGYYQTLMVGSVASFGGRSTYYKTHGVDHIYDLGTSYKDGLVPYGYWNDWWGFEDKYLYEYAKEELTEISKQDQPFAFTMLTVDTHHIGGFACDLCGDEYEENYENVYRCASRQVSAFLDWLKQQPFYENTTVIVTGDHCSMDAGYFERNTEPSYVRRVYNCFLNCPIQPTNSKNREFSALDMFPTTLASLGCTIEGDRLGLGTNLFSALPTQIELRGYSKFCSDLSGEKDFYASHFFSPEDQSPTEAASG